MNHVQTMTAKDWLNLAYYKPVVFGHECGFLDLSDLHNEWIRSFIYGEGDMTLQAHRGSYKTTCISIAIAIMIIIYPEKTILFQRKTDTDTKEIISQITKMLGKHIFETMSYDLYGTLPKLVTKNQTEISTVLKASPRGVSQVVGMGTTSSITGKHFDIIMTDDIVNISDRISKAERDRTKIMYQELQNIKNRGGRIVNTGTPWHKDDAFSIMPNAQKYDVYSTGMMNADQIQDIRSKMSNSLFSANYELKHIAEEDALFGTPITWKGKVSAIYNGIAHIDASYGGADGTAYTIVKRHLDGWIIFGKLWQKHVDECIGEIMHYQEYYRVGTIYTETNADKGYLAKELIRRGANARIYRESRNKFIKISTALKPRWDSIQFINGTDPEYISQILDYTENAQHDDAPDSLASVILIEDKHIDPSVINKQVSALKSLGL